MEGYSVIRHMKLALIAVLGILVPHVYAGSLSLDADQLPIGTIEYVSTSALEIGIDDRLYRLDSGFQIHGIPGKDRLEQLGTITRGMRVQYLGTEPEVNNIGVIREIRVIPD